MKSISILSKGKKNNNQNNKPSDQQFKYSYSIIPTNFVNLSEENQAQKLVQFNDILRVIENRIKITISRRLVAITVEGQITEMPAMQDWFASLSIGFLTIFFPVMLASILGQITTQVAQMVITAITTGNIVGAVAGQDALGGIQNASNQMLGAAVVWQELVLPKLQVEQLLMYLMAFTRTSN